MKNRDLIASMWSSYLLGVTGKSVTLSVDDVANLLAIDAMMKPVDRKPNFGPDMDVVARAT